jgi:cell division septum initiation protein DivIVA
MDGNFQFDIVKKGDEQGQVQGYIKTVAKAYSDMYASHEEQGKQIARLETENERLEQLSRQNGAEQPSSADAVLIAKALIEAERTAAQSVERARLTAQIEADKIITDANKEVDQLLRMKNEVSKAIRDMRRIIGESASFL